MVIIEELLPENPIEAEVVLHVRQHLRQALRISGAEHTESLALLFGVEVSEGLRQVAATETPIQAAAEYLAAGRSVVALGHDATHVQQCKKWLKQRIKEESAFEKIVAPDLGTLLTLSKARDLSTACRSDGLALPILIEGDTGTGKELLAKAIHSIWSRKQSHKDPPWVPLQVAGMSRELINDELFGHVKGSYTGAEKDRPGKIETADGGTLLIDEIGDLPFDAQVRLLRFLNDGECSRIGDNRSRTLKVRLIACTWHSLEQEAKENKFRLDLLHRTKVGYLYLPSLKERKAQAFDDILKGMLAQAGHHYGFTRSARDALFFHDWPGNLRELRGVLDLALAYAGKSSLRLEDLPAHLQRQYLALPLEQRSAGLLCDAPDDQPLSMEIAAQRVGYLIYRLEESTPMPTEGVLKNIVEFLEIIPDKSLKHQQMLAGLKGLDTQFLQILHREKIAERLNIIYQTELPPLLQTHLAQQISTYGHQLKKANDAATHAWNSLSLETDPWWRFHQAVVGHPLLKGAEQDVVILMRLLLHLLGHLSPEMLEELKGLWKEGDVTGKFWQWLRSYLQTSTEDNVIEDGYAPLIPRQEWNSWTKEQWVAFTEQCSSLRDAADRLEGRMHGSPCSPQTIKNRLDEQRISPNWSNR